VATPTDNSSIVRILIIVIGILTVIFIGGVIAASYFYKKSQQKIQIQPPLKPSLKAKHYKDDVVDQEIRAQTPVEVVPSRKLPKLEELNPSGEPK
jgi:flagellar basal body-associated protein FliL